MNSSLRYVTVSPKYRHRRSVDPVAPYNLTLALQVGLVLKNCRLGGTSSDSEETNA